MYMLYKGERAGVCVQVGEFVPSACPQLRHGSLRLAACCCRSRRVADGGFGFFHPLHLHVSLVCKEATGNTRAHTVTWCCCSSLNDYAVRFR